MRVPAWTNLFFLVFFLSLHFFLIVGCRCLAHTFLLPFQASTSAVLSFIPRPRRCSHSSASAVLPFLGLGRAPFPRPRPCSLSSASAVLRRPLPPNLIPRALCRQNQIKPRKLSNQRRTMGMNVRKLLKA
jgi:hypothetical protein